MKPWNLKTGDIAMHSEEEGILSFTKMDGAYAQWINESGSIVIGHAGEYELRDGIYYPVTE